MHFSQPWALWLLLLLPLALAGLLARELFAGQVRRAFRLPTSMSQKWRRVLRPLAALLALLALIGALLDPQPRSEAPEDRRRLVVGIDVSKSMLAEDIFDEPSAADISEVANRLNSASRLALKIFEELDGQEAGLFFFARNGIEVVAPTKDQGFLRYMVQNTRMAELTESGSDLRVAMATGATLLGDTASQPAGAIILITDGEDTENTPAEIAAQAGQLGQRGLPVYAVGIGRPEATYIPIRRPGATAIEGFYTDAAGLYLRTRLRSDTLELLAGSSGGRYFHLNQSDPETLAREFSSILSLKSDNAEAQRHRLTDYAVLFLAIGVVFYGAHSLL